MKKISPFLRKNCFAGLVLAIVAALAVAGGLDPTFGNGGKVTTYVGSSNSYANAVAIQSDGKIVVAGVPLLTRYNSNGSLDTSFGTNGIVNVSGIDSGADVAIQPDGKILVAGNPKSVVGKTNFEVARLNSNGSLDTTFGTNGIASQPPSDVFAEPFVHSIALQSDGKILVAGEVFPSQGNFSMFQLVRYNSDGSLDSIRTFDVGIYAYPTALVIQADGKILLAGNSYDGNAPGYRLAFVRLNPDLTFDSTFGGNGTLLTDFGNVGLFNYSIALQSDGKMVAVGELGCAPCSSYLPQGYKFALARFNTGGSVDTTFGTNGVVIPNLSDIAPMQDFGIQELKTIVIQPDGKLIVGLDTFDGSHYHFLLTRFNANGSLDTTFGIAGEITAAFSNYKDDVHAVALQPDGRIIAAGSTNNGMNTGIALARYIPGTITPVSTTFISQAANDGWILESTPTSNVGGLQNSNTTTFNVGDDLNNKQYRSILSFNTVSLPDTAVITSAQLKIRIQGVVGTDPFATFGNLLVDIRNGHFGNFIGLEPADFSALTSVGTYQEHILPIINNWYGVNLSAANLGFISKVGVTQFRLRFSLPSDNDKVADYDKFFSGNAPTGYQPQLIVTYYVP
jgi:uncharacterized delta-60 repeat protein